MRETDDSGATGMRQRLIVAQGDGTIEDLVHRLLRSGIPAQREGEHIVMIHWPCDGDQATFWHGVGAQLRVWLRQTSRARIDLAD